jgi:hypothetical protein
MEEQIFLQPEPMVVGTVYSVNGYTGHVTLTTSDLENTSGYQTSEEVASAVGTERNERIAADDALQTQISSVASGTPTPVSSMAGMTDTSKTYLLTTDGYWYYYDGTTWTRGGVYQATGLADFSVTPVKTTFSKRSKNLIDLPNANILEGYPANDGMHTSALTRSLWLPCEPNTTYTVSRSVDTGRFGVATFRTQPSLDPLSTDVEQHMPHFNDSSFSFTTSADSHYMVVFYWNQNYSPNTAEQALNDLCVVEGESDGEVIPSYIINVGTDNLEDASVTPEKTTFTKNTANLFDKDNANVIQGNPSVGTNTIAPSSLTRSIYIPCEGNKDYVIKKMVTARYSVATTSVTPASGATCLQIVYNNTAQQLKIKTSSSANYLVVYLYNSNYDTATLQDILDTLVITEGTEDITEYIPYGKIIEVDTDNINDKAVTASKLSDDLRENVTMTGSLASRNGIYGVQYDITATSSACTRIGNAAGLKNDYIVENTYQLNGGVNDFDNIFPWSDIRRCNLTVDGNGKKTITYEGEDGFALDGSNGNVMVEIPKFYSMRERIGNIEKLCITGEPKSGFTVEPAFVVDGKEQDFIYVSCYHKAEANNGVFSYSGSNPLTYRSLAENIADLQAYNLQSYDITVFLMLQKLMIIEFGNRSVQQFIGGMGRLPFWTADTTNVIDGFGTNFFTFQQGVGQGVLDALWVGERIRVGDRAGGTYSMRNVRTITNITKTGTQYKVEYAGEDMSSELAVGDGVGACPQTNGWCDTLSYHTGRRAFATHTTISNFVSPMRYRYMENVIGNVWEQLAGIRIKNLVVHYNFEPNFNENFNDSGYKTLEYQVPLQDGYPSSNPFILREGYNVNNRLFNLPVLCGNTGGQGKYAGGTFYSSADPTKECEAVVCGGWDTYWWANINTFRGWEYVGIRSGLYGNRAIYRG